MTVCAGRGDPVGVSELRAGDGYTVASLAARTGITVSSVRYYVRKGLLRGHRGHRGQWSLEPSSPARVGFIRGAQEQGLTLPEIAALLHPDHGAARRRHLAVEVERRAAALRVWRDVLVTGAVSAEEGPVADHTLADSPDSPGSDRSTFARDLDEELR